MAWEREGGDAKHEHFVHHYHDVILTGKKAGQVQRRGDKWTHAIKEAKKDMIKLLRDSIEAQHENMFEFIKQNYTTMDLHHDICTSFEK